jgi:hypothetical protein
MNVISYGKDKAITTNDTREGRAQNRRVVISIRSECHAGHADELKPFQLL